VSEPKAERPRKPVRKQAETESSGRELVVAAQDIAARGGELPARSLVRAQRAVSRWANPEGGIAWRRELSLAHYRPLAAGASAVVVWPGRAAPWGIVHDRIAAVDVFAGEVLWEADVDVGLAPGAGGPSYEANGLVAGSRWVEFVGVADASRRSSVHPEGHRVLVRATDLRTNRPLWDMGFEGTLYGGLTAPTADLVVVSCREAASRRAVTVAIDAGSGAVRWTIPHPTEAAAERPVPEGGGAPPIVPLLGPWGWAREVWACDPRSGALSWVRSPQDLFGHRRDDPDRYRVWAQVATADSVIVLAAIVEAFPPSGRWPVRESLLCELELATGFVRWQAVWDRKLSDVVAVDDAVVVVHHGDGFEAVDRSTGRLLWQAAAPIDVHFLKPVLAGGQLLHRDGSHLVVRDRATGALRWRIRVGAEHDAAHTAAPVVVGGRVVCRVNGELVAVDLPARYRGAPELPPEELELRTD
jgi:outer membrane protein assembly factor BamB